MQTAEDWDSAMKNGGRDSVFGIGYSVLGIRHWVLGTGCWSGTHHSFSPTLNPQPSTLNTYWEPSF
jgi:hypothetical protein